MLPYTGDYIEHVDGNNCHFKYYTFTPRPLMRGNLYKLDDELSNLLIDAHRNIGFLAGLLKFAPNKNAFGELMLLKECTYSLMIDYNSPSFQDVLLSRGSGKGNILSITNLEMAYKVARDKIISAPDLGKLCGIALYGDPTSKPLGIRDRQTFLQGVSTSIKTYNPTAPDDLLPALADISAYLYNDKDTDPLIQAALVHYQFEMIHPFEQYNGIVGRIIIPMILRDTANEALPLLCLSEYLYYNKNEYFDLLRTTQYSGGYIRWIKFFVNALGEIARRSARLLVQYENAIFEAEQLIKDSTPSSKSIWSVYNYLKKFPISNISSAMERTSFSFNSVSKAMRIMKEKGIVQESGGVRNRIWEYTEVVYLLLNQPPCEE